MVNPCPTQEGFELRLAYASKALMQRGVIPDYNRGIYEHDLTARRAFDNCFENFDGNAVVFALMEKAQRIPQLMAGIVSMGGTMLEDWGRVHAQGRDLLARQLELFN